MVSCFPDMYSTILAPTDRVVAARFFRVLGDPTRLHILELLEEKERTVGELVSAVGQPQPRVSTRLALRGLDQIVDEADVALEPIAERLATCTRIGPDWV